MNNPLSQLGDIAKLKKMQDEMKKESASVEEQGVKATVSGDLQLKEIIVDGVNEDRIVRVVNQALRTMQQNMASKLMSMQ